VNDSIHSVLLDQHTTFFCPGGRAHTNPFTVTTVSRRTLPICWLISGRCKRSTIYTTHLNDTNKFQLLMGGLKLLSAKLVPAVYFALPPRYMPMKSHCPCWVFNHPCESDSACSCIFRRAVHYSMTLVIRVRWTHCWEAVAEKGEGMPTLCYVLLQITGDRR
jgi:hypothetical protein